MDTTGNGMSSRSGQHTGWTLLEMGSVQGVANALDGDYWKWDEFKEWPTHWMGTTGNGMASKEWPTHWMGTTGNGMESKEWPTHWMGTTGSAGQGTIQWAVSTHR